MIKARISRLFSFWSRISVRTQLFLCMSVVALAGAWMMTGVAIGVLRKERAQQTEIATNERAFAQANSARLILENVVKKKTGVPVDKDTESPKNMGLSRWPIKNEIYIGVKGENTLVLWQDKSKVLLSTPFSEAANPWTTNESVSYWFTKEGALIQSNSLKIERRNFSERRLFKFFARTGSYSGSNKFVQDETPTHGAYQLVPDSNVFVGVETAAPLAPAFFLKLFLSLVVVSLLLLMGAFVVATYGSDYVRRVFRETGQLMRHQSSVDLKTQLDVGMFPEVREIFELVYEQNNALETRLTKLESVQAGLYNLLAASVEMHTLTDKFKILNTAAYLAVRNVKCSEELNCWAYLIFDSDPNESILFQTAQMIARGNQQEGPLFLGALEHPIDVARVLSESQPYIEAQTALLLVPILHQKETLGFLVIEGLLVEKLSEFDLFLLRAVSLLTGSALTKQRFLEGLSPKQALSA